LSSTCHEYALTPARVNRLINLANNPNSQVKMQYISVASGHVLTFSIF
jgi:hypothetical protein